MALWYREPEPVSTPDIKKATDKKDSSQGRRHHDHRRGFARHAAAAAQGFAGSRATPSCPRSKFARRWLYSKGIMLPGGGLQPGDVELEDFFECCKDPMNHKPKANLEHWAERFHRRDSLEPGDGRSTAASTSAKSSRWDAASIGRLPRCPALAAGREDETQQWPGHHPPKSILNVAPFPGSLSTEMCPLWSLTTDCTIASPNPVPCVLVV